MEKGKIIAVLSDIAGMCAACKQPIRDDKKPVRTGYVECVELNGKRYHKQCVGLKE